MVEIVIYSRRQLLKNFIRVDDGSCCDNELLVEDLVHEPNSRNLSVSDASDEVDKYFSFTSSLVAAMLFQPEILLISWRGCGGHTNSLDVIRYIFESFFSN